jgi:hypothetical protein
VALETQRHVRQAVTVVDRVQKLYCRSRDATVFPIRVMNGGG